MAEHWPAHRALGRTCLPGSTCDYEVTTTLCSYSECHGTCRITLMTTIGHHAFCLAGARCRVEADSTIANDIDCREPECCAAHLTGPPAAVVRCRGDAAPVDCGGGWVGCGSSDPCSCAER